MMSRAAPDATTPCLGFKCGRMGAMPPINLPGMVRCSMVLSGEDCVDLVPIRSLASGQSIEAVCAFRERAGLKQG
jgi:hypothetical protein